MQNKARITQMTVLPEGGALFSEFATKSDRTPSQKLADAGFTRRPSLWAMQAREILELIAAPKRADGTWNRDRESCRQLAAEALGRDEGLDEQNGVEQGATPPAPAAAKSIHALLAEACTTLEMWADVAPAVSLVRDIRAALAASPQPAAPEGWKLVPIEPTPRMLAAMWDHRDRMAGRSENNIARAGYAAMLAAAPAAKGGAS